MYKACIIVSINNEYELTEHFFSNLIPMITEEIQLIVVIDGLNSINTLQYLNHIAEQHSTIKIINQSINVGYSIANNLAVSYADSEYLIFLNSDTLPIKNSLNTMISYMDIHPDVGVAQGLILYPQTNKVQSTGHLFSFFKTAHAFDGASINSPLVNLEGERQALGSAFYITPKKLFLEEGGFDELYYNAWEGLEYSLKIHLKNYKCMYLPQAKAYHIKGSGRNRIWRDETYQTGYFWSKWKNSIRMDLIDFYQMQMNKQILTAGYYIINASSIRTNIWEIMLEPLHLHKLGEFQVQKSITKTTVSIEDSIPYSLIENSTPLLFLTDSYSDIINNYRVFKYRNLPMDIILDLKGNLIEVQAYYQTLGSR